MVKDDRKRLLVVALNYAPELTGIGKYVGEMTEWLGSRDVAIRVITAPPYYPAWRINKGYRSMRYTKERLAGADVYRCPVWVPRQPRARARILHLLSFAISSLPVIIWQALSWRPHVVFAVEPPLGAAPAAWLAARLAGANAWLHVQDFEIDAGFDLGILKHSILKRFIFGAERWLMRRFDYVSNIADGMRAKLRAKGVADERILFFPNWVDTTMIRPLESENPLRAELAIKAGVRVALYSGNMGEKQGLETILDVARQFSGDAEVLFLLCGEGAARARIGEAAKHLSNVRMIPLQPLAKLNQLLNLADVHLLPQRAAAEDLALPSKLGAILASGKPVVATARTDSDVARFAQHGGLVVAPADTVAFELAIRRLLGDETLCRQLGATGRAFALANWEREAVMRRTFAQLPEFDELARSPATGATEAVPSEDLVILHAEEEPVRL